MLRPAVQAQKGSAQPIAQADSTRPWWKTSVIYEVFPRSFQDTNGDGIGDIKGITAHLDYLSDLGIDAIWITPCFPSPLIDYGYDVSDYQTIAPEFGTLEDMDQLIAQAKKHHIRILLDLVVNHTSDQNPWFKESKSSSSNPKRNWYIWHDGKGAAPPNNWQSEFLTPAWTLDSQTNQWYYHAFWQEQPDLNWRNKEVRTAMYDVIRFWLRRGVSGFRLDAVPSLFEDPELKDDPNQYDRFHDAHQVLREMHAVAHEFQGDRVLLGETFTFDAKELSPWYGQNDELDLALNFPINSVDKLSAPTFRERLNDIEKNLGGQPTYFFSSHDEVRAYDRYGDGVHNDAIAKLMATFLLTTRATPVMYYGEEIGMKNTTPTRREDVKDTDGIRNWPIKKGRDGGRTPMQWNSSTNAGFSHALPWLPIPLTDLEHNVAKEANDRNSILNYYKQLLKLRHDLPALNAGSLEIVDNENANVLSFIRKSADGPEIVVTLNMSDEIQQLDSSKIGRPIKDARILLRSGSMTSSPLNGTLQLLPFEGALYQIR